MSKQLANRNLAPFHTLHLDSQGPADRNLPSRVPLDQNPSAGHRSWVLATIVELFVAKAKRGRILTLGAKPARRADLIDALLHDTRSLDRARLAPVAESLAAVLAALGAREAATAYCISVLSDLDDRELPLGDALRTAIGRQEDTLVYCPTTRRAYLETHEGDRYILAPAR